jgi:plasmid replication initiation protein
MAEQKSRAKVLKVRTEVSLPERYVSMSNAIARGAQGLNLSQKRIIALAMAMTDSLPVRDLIDGGRVGWTVRLSALDYAETYEVSADTAYEQLKTSGDSLMRCLWNTVEKGKKGNIITKGPWCTLAKYYEGQGLVDITFHNYVAPHLLALRTEFTTYKLKQAAALRSVYAWRLFECLQSWKSKGRWTPSIDDFLTAMDAPESCHKDFGNLRKRVIEPAVKELRQKDGFLLEWESKKAGRKVIGLSFTFSKDPQGHLDL